MLKDIMHHALLNWGSAVASELFGRIALNTKNKYSSLARL